MAFWLLLQLVHMAESLERLSQWGIRSRILPNFSLLESPSRPAIKMLGLMGVLSISMTHLSRSLKNCASLMRITFAQEIC